MDSATMPLPLLGLGLALAAAGWILARARLRRRDQVQRAGEEAAIQALIAATGDPVPTPADARDVAIAERLRAYAFLDVALEDLARRDAGLAPAEPPRAAGGAGGTARPGSGPGLGDAGPPPARLKFRRRAGMEAEEWDEDPPSRQSGAQLLPGPPETEAPVDPAARGADPGPRDPQ